MAKRNIRDRADKATAPGVSAEPALRAVAPASPAAPGGLRFAEVLAVAGLMLAGFLVRLLSMPATGHETDLGTFESWTLSLVKYGIHGFYDHAGFVDYPPGYIFVLAASGWFYHLFAGMNLPFDLLKFSVKLPAVLADLGLIYLSFLLVRRTWSSSAALWVAAIVAFNPAIWFLSAYWGQGDAVTAVFMLWAVYFMVTERFELGWLMFSFAVLIKPQPIVVAPLLLVWQLRSARRWWRLALIPLVGFGVAYLGSVFFGPTKDPIALMSWLYDRYHTGTALYPYNSCNAFNLYSTRLDFWQPDNKLIPNLANFQGWPQWAWGVAIVTALVAAVSLREWRTTGPEYTRAEREGNFYMAMFVALLGFFMFATRMHERYLFSALALGPLIWNVSRLSRVVYVILSFTFLVNLWYALQYLYNPQADLYPFLVHPLSLLNVVCLFAVAGAYLVPEMNESLDHAVMWLGGRVRGGDVARRRSPLAWEGLIGMTRTDGLIVGGLMAVTALLLYTNINRPAERIFDEIYYARAAQEYIHHLPQFEWTHPPLTKLLLTIGAMLYKVDPVGARLMSALFGTLTVPLLYAFAKRLFSSSAAAALAVFFLLTSGYFYVQARIATPEIFVAFFALATIYCMYRFWLAGQIVRAARGVVYPDGTRVEDDRVVFPSRERLPLGNAALSDGDIQTKWSAAGVHIDEGDKVVEW
ncbi:MAG: glycosyltransferase family 39 protein, partial [Candidatus Eremiobacteraeota bacterium]|nr:glycosyltransferase family 39 protein [Candidatus Eremiobacteraeota bacterium]